MVCALPLQAQADGQAAKAKEAAYQSALQELTLFKSRTSAALLQVPAACMPGHLSSRLQTSL